MGRRHRFRRHRFNSHKSFRKPSIFQQLNWFCKRHPIIASIGSIFLGIFLIRATFSNSLFGNDITEFKIWFIGGGVLFIIVGLFSLKIWIKRNVPTINTQHHLTWRNR